MKILNSVNKIGNAKDTFEIANRAKILKQTKMMNREKKKKAALIIHAASLGAGSVGAGLAQLPGSDAAIIVPIQVAMVVSLSKLFDRPLKEGVAKSLVMQTTATMVGRGVSEFLVGWIPIAGNVINAGTASIITETLGWIIANEFSEDALSHANQEL
ncbi:MAG: hypothetical protein LBD38_03905 [Streptococcaceae bacterium]|nr:hypothetical protein [Streptococcaceae bacterium]